MEAAKSYEWNTLEKQPTEHQSCFINHVFKEKEHPGDPLWRVFIFFIETVWTKPLHLNYRQIRRNTEDLLMICGRAEGWNKTHVIANVCRVDSLRGSFIFTVKTKSLFPLGENKSDGALNESKSYFKLSFSENGWNLKATWELMSDKRFHFYMKRFLPHRCSSALLKSKQR